MSQSPFPGMDPYLEQSWRDVHQRLCMYACDDIQSQLSGGLVARVEERLIVESPLDDTHSIHPDVLVVLQKGRASATSPLTGGLALAEPLLIQADPSDLFEGFIQILDPRGGQVITIIEFLSPTNKTPGPGIQQYQRKQQEVLQSETSLVEIDLLRGGSPATQLHPSRIPSARRSVYHAVTHRSWAGNQHEYFAMPLNLRLPLIPIPLRKADKDVVLDIQSLIDRVYRNGAYHVTIDYSQPPEPPFTSEAAEWSDQLLRAAGKR